MYHTIVYPAHLEKAIPHVLRIIRARKLEGRSNARIDFGESFAERHLRGFLWSTLVLTRGAAAAAAATASVTDCFLRHLVRARSHDVSSSSAADRLSQEDEEAVGQRVE